MSQALTNLFDTIAERSFYAIDTFRVLKTKPIWLGSWGARSYKQVPSKDFPDECGVFFFRVSGYLHKGYVVITLGWNDTYTVRLVNMRGDVKKTLTDIYFDQLCETIDIEVERQKKYVS